MDYKMIQKLLNEWIEKRDLPLVKLVVDGKWGAKSISATKLFQKYTGLTPDGIPGAKTQYKLMFYKYPNFDESEFACPCGRCGGFPVKVNEGMLMLVQGIRNHFGKGVHINSAVRCKSHNAAVNGEPNSQHLLGTAADISVSGVLPSAVYSYANSINPNGGVGKYRTFTHVDWRGVRARW